MTRFKGFTLVELMVVVALLAIMASIAIPSFQTLILNNRLSNATNALLTGLQLARSEAVTNRTAITVCGANTSHNACANSSNWSNGALILQGTTLIRSIPLDLAGVTVSSTANNLTYNSNGTTTAATLTVSDSRGASSARTITVNVIGPSCIGNPCP